MHRREKGGKVGESGARWGFVREESDTDIRPSMDPPVITITTRRARSQRTVPCVPDEELSVVARPENVDWA